MTQICIKCKHEHLATPEFFYRDKKAKGGLTARCKDCFKKSAKPWSHCKWLEWSFNHAQTYYLK